MPSHLASLSQSARFLTSPQIPMTWFGKAGLDRLLTLTAVNLHATHGLAVCHTGDDKCAGRKPVLDQKKLKPMNPTSAFFRPLLPFQSTRAALTSVLFRLGYDPRLPANQRKKIVVLGTGWASIKFIKSIDVRKYDVVIVSPKPYFSFTPLLPSVCTGVVSARATMEPIRKHLTRGGKIVMDYCEASANKLVPEKKVVTCVDRHGKTFDLNYDYIVIGVGSEVNTFGIPGVAENALYLKNAVEAEQIHQKLLECVEQAALPTSSIEDKKRLLSFVIVGAGPSGVEVAAELCDFINEDLHHHYPELAPLAQVTLVEMLDRVLPSFYPASSEFTLKTLEKIKCNVQLKSRVTKVTPEAVHFMDAENKEHVVPYGFVLWASGIGQTAFGKHLLSACESQKQNRILKIDENLKVRGEPGCYAFGDCALFSPKLLVDNADALFASAAKNKDKAPANWLKNNAKKLSVDYPQLTAFKFDEAKFAKEPMDKLAFVSALREIDMAYRPPPPTAQAATREAVYLADCFNKYHPDPGAAKIPAWNFVSPAQMSYVGGGNSVIQTIKGSLLGGFWSHYLWRTAYFSMLFSYSAQLACLTDWIRAGFAGRDLAGLPIAPPKQSN